MFIRLETLNHFLLAYIGLTNLLVFGYYVKISWRLFQLWRGKDGSRYNGITFAMALERSVLAILFIWNFYQSVQSIANLVSIEENYFRFASLLGRAILGTLLLAVIGLQDIKMNEKSNDG